MNLRDLSYLIALVDHCHFGKAAEACFVSQPALSMQIKKLEKYLGIQLLERTNKSVLLTEAGLLIALKAREILTQIAEMKETAKSLKDLYCGELRIGIIPTLAPYLLPHIMPTLSATYPKLNIYLIEEQTSVIVKQLKDGKLDATILALPIFENGLVTKSLFQENFVLAVPNTHTLAKRKWIKQTDLANQHLLLLEEGHCLRDQALALCQLAKANEVKSFRATSLETLRHMVAHGVGMTLIPELACKPGDGIHYLFFKQPKPMRRIGMQWRLSTAKENLLQEISHHIKKTMINTQFLKL